MIWATEYIVRLGFFPGDYRNAAFRPDAEQPFVLDAEFVGFELNMAFPYSALIGMDVIGLGDLTIRRDGIAQFQFA